MPVTRPLGKFSETLAVTVEGGGPSQQPVDRAAADRLLDKLRDLVEHNLDDDERALFAALLAPGLEQAYGSAEVEGFSADWGASTLPAALADAVRDRQVRIEGL